jgi:hypothetical protein
MALLKSYGVGDGEIIKDYLRTKPQCFLADNQEMLGGRTIDTELELGKDCIHIFHGSKGI